MAIVWRALRGIFLALAAVVVFVEEVGWRPLAAFAGRFATWPPVARLEARIVRLPPRVALVLFLAPAVLLFPVKVAALWAIDEGHVALGATVIVAAKLFGTAVVGRLFVLLEPQLRVFPWFVLAMDWWQRTRSRAAAWVRRSALSRTLRGMRCSFRRWRRRQPRIQPR